MLISTSNDRFSRRFGPIEATKRLIDAGFTALDCSMMIFGAFPYTDDYRETAKEMRRIADERGIPFNQAHAPFGGYSEYLSDIVPLFEKAFEAANILGIPVIVVHPTQYKEYHEDPEGIYKFNVEFYRSLLPLSKRYGVKIAIENMWSRDSKTGDIIDAILSSAEEMKRMYDELADPDSFTVCLDIGHLALTGKDLTESIKLLGKERLGALHVHDVVKNRDLHTMPGLGMVDWEAMERALADIGYEGELTLEADGYYDTMSDDEIQAAAEALAAKAKEIASHIEAYKI